MFERKHDPASPPANSNTAVFKFFTASSQAIAPANISISRKGRCADVFCAEPVIM